jgi:hypothetical protein
MKLSSFRCVRIEVRCVVYESTSLVTVLVAVLPVIFSWLGPTILAPAALASVITRHIAIIYTSVASRLVVIIVPLPIVGRLCAAWIRPWVRPSSSGGGGAAPAVALSGEVLRGPGRGVDALQRLQNILRNVKHRSAPAWCATIQSEAAYLCPKWPCRPADAPVVW